MASMPNAPVVYMIGMVRFPKVPGMERFVPAFHDAVRASYPQNDEVAAQALNAEIGPAGVKFEQIQTKVWQFAAPDKSFAFLLGDEFLGLHTSNYKDHQDFARRFDEGLQGLLGVPDMGIAWVQALGIRYIDLIVPRPGEALTQYLHPQALPMETLVEDDRLELQESLAVTGYRTQLGGVLRVQVLRNPPTTIPPELDSPLVEKNGWKPVRPEGDFVVLDIDHGTRFDPLVEMDPAAIRGLIAELRGAANRMFHSVSTDFARSVWKNVA